MPWLLPVQDSVMRKRRAPTVTSGALANTYFQWHTGCVESSTLDSSPVFCVCSSSVVGERWINM